MEASTEREGDGTSCKHLHLNFWLGCVLFTETRIGLVVVITLPFELEEQFRWQIYMEIYAMGKYFIVSGQLDYSGQIP